MRSGAQLSSLTLLLGYEKTTPVWCLCFCLSISFTQNSNSIIIYSPSRSSKYVFIAYWNIRRQSCWKKRIIFSFSELTIYNWQTWPHSNVLAVYSGYKFDQFMLSYVTTIRSVMKCNTACESSVWLHVKLNANITPVHVTHWAWISHIQVLCASPSEPTHPQGI